MSADNFDGDGHADQPSVIYSYESGDSGDTQICELSRSGYGELGSSPGDVIERSSTKSSLTDRLPKLELTGQQGLKYPDCGEDIPAFACLGHSSEQSDGCGKPIYVGRTCASPSCERGSPSAIKRKGVRGCGKLEGLRRALYARYDGRKDIDFNHVVASLPSLRVDSDEPLERTLLILKTLLEENWHIEGFLAIYHPYRIKKEYRKDQYEHGGAEGEGEMVWSDVLNKENPMQYLKFEPHFHVFFPAVRKAFDYMTAEAVHQQSGWLFHRITKSDEDNNVSVTGLDDLVHQVTYCLSHAPVRQTDAGRDELATRMKGDLHNCYIPDGAEEQALAAFCDAAPKLLGVKFANLNEATCQAEVDAKSSSEGSDEDSSDTGEIPSNHPLDDVWNPSSGTSTADAGSGNPWSSHSFEAAASDGSGGRSDDNWFSSGTGGQTTAQSTQSEAGFTRVEEEDDSDTTQDSSSLVDDRTSCGGTLRPIHEADGRLNNPDWCQQAEYVAGLRDAYQEWRRRADSDHPWVENPDDDGDGYPGVVQGD